jgi:hypothetical protein
MATNQGCGTKSLGCLILIVIAGFGINTCVQKQEAVKVAEQQRRTALTPEQRAAEDKAAADEAAKQKADAEALVLDSQAGERSKDFVLQFLKHPDDASFGVFATPDVTHNETRNVFYCRSTVKAKNDFGMQLTYRWETIISFESNTWSLVSCQIDGKTVYDDEALFQKLETEKTSAEAARLNDAQKESAAEAARRAKAAKEKIEAAKWHVWTTADGAHTTDAKFVSMTFGEITLEKRDGSRIKVKKEILSPGDREWVEKRGWETAK